MDAVTGRMPPMWAMDAVTGRTPPMWAMDAVTGCMPPMWAMVAMTERMPSQCMGSMHLITSDIKDNKAIFCLGAATTQELIRSLRGFVLCYSVVPTDKQYKLSMRAEVFS